MLGNFPPVVIDQLAEGLVVRELRMQRPWSQIQASQQYLNVFNGPDFVPIDYPVRGHTLRSLRGQFSSYSISHLHAERRCIHARAQRLKEYVY